ncbi:hypothetical protein OHB41_02650 [Streptomyces sp. NBC_01571]|uniref:hypothetical protein n=1 Tax=Streptomyces sp. NBC_01571 TaxID=2975883 RepID=UPI002250F0EC|nr:hypothetical protein [Streptomyces sp. NBC_01571]MCX4572100.1 hypothetical protein [Streptomyces sp. NBC_01571]
MDHFERELARMMRDAEEQTPFEPAQQDRLRAGVRVRRRVRSAQKAVGSVLAVAGLGAGLFLLPHTPKGDRPQAPLPQPMTGRSSPNISPTPTLTPSPTPTPTRPSSGAPTGSATTTPDDTSTTSSPPTAPSSTGGSTSIGTGSSGTATTSPPPGASSTPSESITPPPPTTTLEPSSFADATDTG